MGYTLAKLMDNAGYICTRNQWIYVFENIVGPIITKEQLVKTADWKELAYWTLFSTGFFSSTVSNFFTYFSNSRFGLLMQLLQI